MIRCARRRTEGASAVRRGPLVAGALVAVLLGPRVAEAQRTPSCQLQVRVVAEAQVAASSPLEISRTLSGESGSTPFFVWL